jgi:hypothetical protein
MEKVASATFLEPAIFGFRKSEKGVAPFTQRIPKGETQESYFSLLQAQMTAGMIQSANLCAGYVRLNPPNEIPGGLEKNVDAKGFAIIKFQQESDLVEFNKGDEVSVYKQTTRTDKTIFVLGK